MGDRIEYSTRHRPEWDIITGLARAAGMEAIDLADDVAAGGREAAFRRAAEKAVQRRAAERKGDPRQRLVELLRRRLDG